MQSLLVVEDEKLIRRGICAMAKRSEVPIDEIIECSNGEEALEIIKSRHIDVMFTDIRMPKMDGITLVQEIQKLHDKPITVAVSGFDDFSYAVEMLRNGVREYILKPVERDKVSEILKKFNEEIINVSKKEKTEIAFGKHQLRYLLTNDIASEEELTVIKEKFDEMFFKEDFVVCCTKGGAAISLDNPGILEIKNVADSNVYVLEKKALEQFLNEELDIYCAGVSSTHYGVEKIRDAYLEAISARKTAFAITKSFVFGDSKTKIPFSLKMQAEKILTGPEMSQRLQLIGTGRVEELVKHWEKLFVAVADQQISVNHFEAAQEHFVEDASRMYRSSMSAEEFETLQNFRHILAFDDIEEYKEEFISWIISLNEKIENKDDSNANEYKILKAIDYIKKNYSSDINMAVVSNYVSMNYSLFSLSFKQYTGMNFVNYLKELRMEEAKRMLAETQMKVIEISQNVGYDNEKHFMKAFKGYCGVSPTEYRKNSQR